MKQEERIQKYLFLMRSDFSKMMKAYFRMRSYESKLNKMDLNEEEEKKFIENKEYIKNCMKRFL